MDKKNILKMLFKRISAFLFIGKQNKNFYKSYGISEEKLFFTPYTVDNKRLQSSYNNLKPKKNNFRARLGIKEEDIVILFVGKFIHKKRPLHLLEAYKKVLNLDKNNNKIHLVFVGEGELRIEMENYINKNNLSYVHLVGFKNQTELPEYYTMSDMFILPSGVGETWGLVTNEAMNFELPIIISDMPGSGYDLVKDGENGYMFQLGNIDDLSNKIFKLVKDKEKREKFGEKSFEFIKNYNYEKDVEGILKALNLN
jgi:glycosyltransferase involved in cell wall biosynthesis